jgi:hypothetical protein
VPTPTFVHGFATGVATTAMLLHVWLAFQLAGARGMYADFGGELPVMTRLVIDPVWLWSVPGIAASGLVVLVVKRPRGLTPYALAAAVLAATVFVTWYFAHAPIRQLADNLRAG